MKKKYELTTDIIQHNGVTLYRIKALIDIPEYNISVGDLGGYIQSEDNLSHKDNCWVENNAKVYGKAQVYDNALVRDNAWVYGKAHISDNAIVHGNARVFTNAWVFGNARVYGNSKIFGKIHIGLSTQVKDVELDGIYSFNDFIKLYPIKIKDDKAILYKAVHKIDDKYLSDYNKNFEYKINQIHQHKCNTNIYEDCSYGLNVATREWAIDYSKDWNDLALLEVEVQLDKLIIPLSTNGKIRTSKLRILREVPNLDILKYS